MNIFRWRRRRDAELDEEIRSHLDEAIRDRIERGESREQARANAMREFGNVGLVKEVTREMWGWASLDSLLQDLRFGLRILRKRPGLLLTAVLTLALGIGVNTAIFSLANAILLRPLPVKDGDRIVDLRISSPRDRIPRGIPYPDYLELRKRTGASVDLFGINETELVLGASGAGSAMADSEAEGLDGLFVTGNYFSALGGAALLGRTLMPEDDQAEGAHPIVVLSHCFWQRRYGAAPDIVGKTILINARALTVVGVTEGSFTGAEGRAPDVWLPLLMRHQLITGDNRLAQRSNSLSVRVMGRLQPGVLLQQAEAAFKLAYSQLEQGQFRYDHDLQIKLETASLLSREERQTLTAVLSVALGAVTLVLLIACLNVAGLTLARNAARQREIAVRLSLGASRGRVLRQLFTESLLLAGAGGMAGLLLSHWTMQALGIQLDPGIPPRGVPLDWRVLAYTLGISVFTAVVVGLLPAWQTTRFNLIPALKQEGTGFNLQASRFPLRSLLVVVQIALSLVLLLGAGLFARTALRLTTMDPGFEPKNLSFVNYRFGTPRSAGYDETRAAQFQRELQECLLATPMVKDAVWFSRFPLPEPIEDPGHSIRYGLDVEGRSFKVHPGGMVEVRREGARGPDGKLIMKEEEYNFAAHNEVTPNYFAVLGMPLLYGRTFNEHEARDGADVVVINEALQRRHWPGENPVGKSLWTEFAIREIIGVAKDNTLLNPWNEPYLYMPAPLKNGRLDLKLLVKSEPRPARWRRRCGRPSSRLIRSCKSMSNNFQSR